MNLSIVVVTYNSEETISQCLESVVLLKDSEVTVVDNFSQDETIEKIKKFDSVTLIENSENKGFGTANNQAIKKAQGEYIFLLNPDAYVKQGSLEKMIDFMEKNPQVAVAGPKLISPEGQIQQEMGPFPNLVDQSLILLKLHHVALFAPLVHKVSGYDELQEADHLMGAALLIRKSVFEEVGGFDENFFLWFEETDLLLRIKTAGYKLIYFPDGVVVHLKSQSTKKINPFKRQALWNTSLRYFFKKHKSVLERIVIEPFTYLSFLPTAAVYLKDKIL